MNDQPPYALNAQPLSPSQSSLDSGYINSSHNSTFELIPNSPAATQSGRTEQAVLNQQSTGEDELANNQGDLVSMSSDVDEMFTETNNHYVIDNAVDLIADQVNGGPVGDPWAMRLRGAGQICQAAAGSAQGQALLMDLVAEDKYVHSDFYNQFDDLLDDDDLE